MTDMNRGVVATTEPNGGSIADVLRIGRRRLASARTETPGLDAEVLLRHVLGINRTALFAQLSDRLDETSLTVYESLLEDRSNGVPIAYLTGEREFMGLSLAVGPEVLIPRPETEILVEWALEWLRGRGAVKVVDIGTGSGAIALSLAALLGPTWAGQIIASDVSTGALVIATQNRDRLGLTKRVELVHGSLIDWLHDPVDLLLANLPYLCPRQIAENSELAAEPRLALDGGVDGLELIAALLGDAPRVVRPGGAIGLEIDPGQRAAVTALAATAIPGSDIAVLRDLAGRERHIVVMIPPVDRAS